MVVRGGAQVVPWFLISSEAYIFGLPESEPINLGRHAEVVGDRLQADALGFEEHAGLGRHGERLGVEPVAENGGAALALCASSHMVLAWTACAWLIPLVGDERHGRDGGVGEERGAEALGGEGLADGLGGVSDRVEPGRGAGRRVQPEPPQVVGVNRSAVEPVHGAHPAVAVGFVGDGDPAAAERLQLGRAKAGAGAVGDQAPGRG